MATVVEQQRSQPLVGYADYEHMRLPGPQFTNPWATPAANIQQHQQQQQQLYNTQQSQQQHQASDPYATRSQYSSTSAASSVPSVTQMPQSRSFAPDFVSSAANATPSFTATSGDRFPTADHYNASYAGFDSRYNQYQTSARSFRPSASARNSFHDALDAGQGMVAMSQQDFTPRSAYPPRNGSTDSYGFPATHSSDHGSSISSGSSYPYYGSYSGSTDGSVASSAATDYSSASEEPGQRTLPPPGQLVNGFPANATQMMSQFNSKLAASAQKKHKCKICDKRFTRPSSLQTHMYSHTGEKPFACDFEGCGRHFSVVSNLRRHKKCHKGDGSVDSESPEE